MERLKQIGRYIIAPLDFLMKYFKLLVLLIVVLVIFGGSDESNQNNANLAKIYLRDIILQSDDFRKQVEFVQKHKNIKGVLLIVNSPGGGVGASIEVANLVKELRDSVPVVVHTEGAMASGSYYAGMYGDKIIANRGALIGSIGVILNGYNIKPLLDKIGIQEQTIKEGEYKAVGTMTREWSPKEKEYLQKFLKGQYQMFVQDVIEARNLGDVSPSVFAEGKIFSAKEALKIGLIDKIGSQKQAIKELCEIAQVEEPIWLERSKAEEFLEKLSETSTKVVLKLLQGQIQ